MGRSRLSPRNALIFFLALITGIAIGFAIGMATMLNQIAHNIAQILSRPEMQQYVLKYIANTG